MYGNERRPMAHPLGRLRGLGVVSASVLIKTVARSMTTVTSFGGGVGWCRQTRWRRSIDVVLDCAQRRVLGPDVDIVIDVIDETNTRVNVPKLLRRFSPKANGFWRRRAYRSLQTNQYPRALDIARAVSCGGHPGRHRAAFTYPAALPCSTGKSRRSRSCTRTRRPTFSPGEPKDGLKRCCRTPPTAASSLITIQPTISST